MKIYNRKIFVVGLGLLLLAVVFCVLDLKRGAQNLDASFLMRTVALLVNSGICIIRSLSRDLSKEDQINERDERNRSNYLKAKGRAYDLTIWGGLIAAMVLAVWGTQEGPGPSAYVAVGVFLTCVFAFIAQSVLFFYFDKRH